MTPEAQEIKKQIVDSDLLWAYNSMLRHLRENTHFDADRVEQVLWERIVELKTSTPTPSL